LFVIFKGSGIRAKRAGLGKFWRKNEKYLNEDGMKVGAFEVHGNDSRIESVCAQVLHVAHLGRHFITLPA
jgi:hypothetical protein